MRGGHRPGAGRPRLTLVERITYREFRADRHCELLESDDTLIDAVVEGNAGTIGPLADVEIDASTHPVVIRYVRLRQLQLEYRQAPTAGARRAIAHAFETVVRG